MKAVLTFILSTAIACAFGQQAEELIAANGNEESTDAGPIALAIDEQSFPHSVSAKVLFVDYGVAESQGSSVTNGIDFAYVRRISELLSVSAPLKLGVLNEVENPSVKQAFISLDLTAQAGHSILNDRLRPYALAGFGLVTEPGNGANLQLPLGVGLRIRLTDAAYLTGQYEFRKSFANQRDNTQVGIGLLFNLGRGKFNPAYWDSDGDGVMDLDDQCQHVRGSSRLNGCPDSDNDGIHDGADPCPLHYGTAKEGGCPDADGDGIGDPHDECPDVAGSIERNGCPIPDRDKDGVADEEDGCPDLAGTLAGCPDTDADGISDLDDECPKQAGPKATMGCPDRDNDSFADINDNCPLMPGKLNGCPDRDKDGVDDASDRCPNIAGAYNGCPEIIASQQQLFEFAVRAVGFESGSTTLSTYAFETLTGLADVMEAFPEYKLKITGHADFTEVVPDRERFSLARAQACAVYMQSRGIDPSRISVDGVGAGRPLRREGDEQDRAVNRRVEFDLSTEE